MSQANVELVRRVYEEGGPIALPLSVEDEQAADHLFRDDYNEQFEIRMPTDYPEGEQVLRGREGLRQLLAMLRETWTEFRFEPERFIDCGHRVAVMIHVAAKGGAADVVVYLGGAGMGDGV